MNYYPGMLREHFDEAIREARAEERRATLTEAAKLCEDAATHAGSCEADAISLRQYHVSAHHFGRRLASRELADAITGLRDPAAEAREG